MMVIHIQLQAMLVLPGDIQQTSTLPCDHFHRKSERTHLKAFIIMNNLQCQHLPLLLCRCCFLVRLFSCTSQLQSNPNIVPPRVKPMKVYEQELPITQYFDLWHPSYTTINCSEQAVGLYWDFIVQKQLKTKETKNSNYQALRAPALICKCTSKAQVLRKQVYVCCTLPKRMFKTILYLHLNLSMSFPAHIVASATLMENTRILPTFSLQKKK